MKEVLTKVIKDVMYKIDIEKMYEGPNKLAKELETIDSMQDSKVYDILRTSYHIFFSNSIDNPCFSDLRKSSKFITILTQVCTDADLTYEQRVYCNSMLYEEVASTEDLYMQKLYYLLGAAVNRDMTNRIISCGVDPIRASYLAFVRKSSFNAKDNITRLNFVIMCADPSLMTVQRITDIYCTIFNTVAEIRELFLLAVEDTYIMNSDEDWITDEVMQTAKNMDYAILSLLDSLSYEDLYKILTDYSNICFINDLDQDDLRFSFKNVDTNKFKNIGAVLNKMHEEDMFIV